MRVRVPVLGLSLLAGCGGAAEPAAAPPPPPPLHPSAEAAPAASSATPIATPSPPPRAPSPFVPVLDVGPNLHFHPVEGALLVTTVGLERDLGDEGQTNVMLVGPLVNDRVEFVDRLEVVGLFKAVVDLVGKWPDKLDLFTTGTTGRTSVAEHATTGPKGWSQDRADVGRMFLGVARVGDTTLGLTTSLFNSPEITTVRGKAPKRVITPVDKAACEKGGDPYRLSAVWPSAFGATRDGKVLSFGASCFDEPAVEIWAPGATKSTIVTLGEKVKGLVDETTWILPSGAAGAWIVGGVLVHFDGSKWTSVAPPVPGKPVTAAAVGPDGALWVIADDALHQRQGEQWSRVSRPTLETLDDLAFAPDGTLWLSAGGVLYAHRPGAPAGAPAKMDLRLKIAPPKRPPVAGSAACDRQHVVVLYGFTKVTPDDYDFPLARKALKGHGEFTEARFVVTRDGGQKYFSAVVPSFDLGKRLAALIEKDVKGAKPQVFCASPEVVRELKIDLRTGEVVK